MECDVLFLSHILLFEEICVFCLVTRDYGGGDTLPIHLNFLFCRYLPVLFDGRGLLKEELEI